MAQSPDDAAMLEPVSLECIGNEVAIRWSDGRETYYPMDFLRRRSPSAENTGEKDLLGRTFAAAQPAGPGPVKVTDWNKVGAYGIQFLFSDGHSTGIYSFDYLLGLADELPA